MKFAGFLTTRLISILSYKWYVFKYITLASQIRHKHNMSLQSSYFLFPRPVFHFIKDEIIFEIQLFKSLSNPVFKYSFVIFIFIKLFISVDKT